MRFRCKNKNKKKQPKISRWQKFKSIRYISNELKKVGDVSNAYKRLAIFYEEYNRIQPIIKEKLKESKILNHTENHNRILSFKNDLDEIKKMIDRVMLDVNNEELDISIKRRILNTRTGTFALLMRKLSSLSIKYRKENCCIDNFEV